MFLNAFKLVKFCIRTCHSTVRVHVELAVRINVFIALQLVNTHVMLSLREILCAKIMMFT